METPKGRAPKAAKITSQSKKGLTQYERLQLRSAKREAEKRLKAGGHAQPPSSKGMTQYERLQLRIEKGEQERRAKAGADVLPHIALFRREQERRLQQVKRKKLK